jgi:hypothetical protein
MTLKQFKESIKIGDNLLMTSFVEGDKDLMTDKMTKMGFITYKDTTGFYIKRLGDTTNRGSFCGWPKASELSLGQNTFTITDDFGARTYQRFNN